MASFNDSARTAVEDLHTIRDILRFGVTEFTRAKLTYGHGTARAIDEAAFMVLTALDLPHDELAPWLDCRLTRAERERILSLFAQRIATRKPAPYLLNAAYIQGHRFFVDERVIVPRSFIGELIVAGLNDLLPDGDGDRVTAVLDMCTGSGCLAILAALTFANARVEAVDVSADALDVAAKNVADYGLGDRIRLVRSDLFAGVDAGARFDLILANPPYVASAEVAAFDAEYRAEPALAHEGGADGLDVVRRIMAAAAGYLKPGGVLVMEIGTGRERFEAEFATLDVMWLATETSDGEVLAVSAEALGRMATAPKRAKRR